MNQIDSDSLVQTENNYESDIITTNEKISRDYGVDTKTADISWPDIETCLWNKQGTQGGPNNNKYF